MISCSTALGVWAKTRLPPSNHTPATMGVRFMGNLLVDGGGRRRISSLEQCHEVAQLRKPQVGRDPVGKGWRDPVQQVVALPGRLARPCGTPPRGPEKDADDVLAPAVGQGRH